MLGQAFNDIACLVDLAALNGRVAAERPADGLGKRLRPIDDEQSAYLRIKAASDQVIKEGLHHGGILRRPPSERLSLTINVRS